MKCCARSALIVIGLLATLSPNAVAAMLTGWVIIYEQASSARPLTVGVAEPGDGFGFVTISDDNGDGLIELPFVPVGSRLALGVDHGDGEACNSTVVGRPIDEPRAHCFEERCNHPSFARTRC